MLPQLEVPVAIQLIGVVITITGVYFTIKFGQAENKALLKALHKRFDDLAKAVVKSERDIAVLEERVNNLRETGRFRIAKLEAERAGQVPMFQETIEE